MSGTTVATSRVPSESSIKTFFSDLPSLRRTALPSAPSPSSTANRHHPTRPATAASSTSHPGSRPQFTTSHAPKYFSSPVPPFAYEHLPREQWISTPTPRVAAPVQRLAIEGPQRADPAPTHNKSQHNEQSTKKLKKKKNNTKKVAPSQSENDIQGWGDDGRW